jgi:hypothetical protein
MNAEDFLQNSKNIDYTKLQGCNPQLSIMPFIEADLIEFAKIKVEEALKSAANNAKTKKKEIPYTGARAGGSYFVDVVDTDSILNAYPLKKIK